MRSEPRERCLSDDVGQRPIVLSRAKVFIERQQKIGVTLKQVRRLT